MAVRLIATDLDGTIVRSDGEISERTVRTLQAAEAAGLLVVFVTGRPPRWMKPVSDATGHTGLAICANGAVVYDLHTEQVVEEFPMDAEVARKLAAEHGITADQVVAFGDMPNDVPMLRWAGHAVAVGNAHPEVMAVVDEVTATNDEDGVALVVERLLGGG